MQIIAHTRETTQLPSDLRTITEDIYDSIDRFALDLGAKLQHAYDLYPDLYENWVETCLPFGLDKARRLRMIHKAAVHLPEHILERCPRPWQALYAITRLPADKLVEAVESGRVHPELTVEQTRQLKREIDGRSTRKFLEAELLIGRLVKTPVTNIKPVALRMLDEWRRQFPEI